MSESIPQSDAELGATLRRLRGRRSLREIAAEAHVSKSSLARYEAGSPVPVGTAAALDRAYEAGGWIQSAIAGLNRGRWEPWRDNSVKRIFAYRWPAQYEGWVWVLIRPHPNNVNEHHSFVIKWGKWQRDFNATLPRDGLIFATGKAVDADGLSDGCTLECEPSAYAMFGFGEMTGIDFVDIRYDWFSPRDPT